jgi:hypothetical protein
VRASSSSVTAYFAKVGKNLKGRADKKRDDKKKKKCTYCKFTGHDVSECQKKKKEQEEKEKSSASTTHTKPPATPSASAKVATIKPVPNEEIVHLFRALSEQLAKPDLQKHWLIDSGASRHMCSNRNWFQQFSQLPTPIKVTLGDDSSINATGISRIHTRMRTNSTWSDTVL